MENENNFPRYLFMLRHAEKVSNITGEKIPNTYITNNGECQANECGMQLSKEISKLQQRRSDNSVLVLCSPFIRCLQSARQAILKQRAKGINIYNDTVYVSSWIKENQKGKDGKRKQFISGEELQNDLDEFQKENLVHFKVQRSEFQMDNEQDHYNKVEEKSDLKNRFGSFIRTIGNAKTIDGYDGQVVICFSHAMFLKQVKNIHVEENQIENPAKAQYKYGTLSCIKFESPDKWDQTVDGFNDHFEQTGLDRYGTYGTDEFKRMDTDPYATNDRKNTISNFYCDDEKDQ